MERKFAVRELTLPDFEALWIACGKPAKENGHRGKCYHPPRYLGVLSDTSFPNFESLICSLHDSTLRPRCIWFPEVGDTRIGAATRNTIDNSPDYGRYLLRLSQRDDAHKLLIQMSSDFSRPLIDDDNFNFRRTKDGAWHLDYFHIKKTNFRFYHFSGLQQKLSHPTPVASGLYIGHFYD